MSCKLVKHPVTSHLVHVETEECNRLLRRVQCSNLLVKRIREEILSEGFCQKAHISVCCARADLRLTYLSLRAALLLPPELLSSVGKCGFCCQAAVGCQLSWELFEEPTHMTRQC